MFLLIEDLSPQVDDLIFNVTNLRNNEKNSHFYVCLKPISTSFCLAQDVPFGSQPRFQSVFAPIRAHGGERALLRATDTHYSILALEWNERGQRCICPGEMAARTERRTES